MDDRETGARATSRIGRLTGDPFRARRISRRALVVLTLIQGIAWSLDGGAVRALLVAAGWILAPFIALGLGTGDGFFIEHGRGTRRALLVLLGGALMALTGCVVLTILPGDEATVPRRLLAGGVYGLFFAAIVLAIGAVIALAIGRGSGYVARRIQQVDDDGW